MEIGTMSPLGVTFVVVSLLLLVLFGAVSSLGIIAAYVPPLKAWIDDQIDRLLRRR